MSFLFDKAYTYKLQIWALPHKKKQVILVPRTIIFVLLNILIKKSINKYFILRLISIYAVHPDILFNSFFEYLLQNSMKRLLLYKLGCVIWGTPQHCKVAGNNQAFERNQCCGFGPFFSDPDPGDPKRPDPS